MSRIRTGLFFRPFVWVTVLCAIYAIAVALRYDTALAWVTLGERFAPDALQASTYSDEGYDGQFVYYLARYGTEAAPYVDRPAYRAQRMLLSVLGWGLSLGQAALLPYALLLVNLLVLAGGTYLLEELLAHYGVSRWFALGYALSLGVFGAARLTTTETLAYGLAIGGIYLMHQQEWRRAALVFALAALSKETALFIPFAYGLHLLYERRWRDSVLFGGMIILPFLAWQGVLLAVFGTPGIGSGGGGATGFEPIPFMGVVRIAITAVGAGDMTALIAFILLVGTFVVVPTLWAIGQCWTDWRYTQQVRAGDKPSSNRRGWGILTTLLLTTVAIMPFVPFSTYREPLGILRFIVGLQIAIILYAAQRRQRRVLLYSTLWFLTSLLVVVSDFA